MNIGKYNIILFAWVSLSMPVVAQADERSSISSQSVVVGDVDLTSAAGQRVVHKRIGRAVENVCPDRFERDLRRQMRARSCQQVARSSADEGLNDYRVRTGTAR